MGGIKDWDRVAMDPLVGQSHAALMGGTEMDKTLSGAFSQPGTLPGDSLWGTQLTLLGRT
jgi:hypothetical protein